LDHPKSSTSCCGGEIESTYGALALDAWNKGGIVARAKPARTKTNGLICLELLIEEKRGPVQPTRSHGAPGFAKTHGRHGEEEAASQ
jgi:hypothetical protein